MTSMTIGQLAKAAGLPVDTIRYYEKIRLVLPARRSAAGYRHYEAKAVQRCAFIVQAKALGFTLAEIEDLLSISAADTSRCGSLLRVTEAKIAATRTTIGELARMKRTLQRLARACPGGNHPLALCPILRFLNAPRAQRTARLRTRGNSNMIR